MYNKSACARYNFDLFSTTLTISKEFESALPSLVPLNNSPSVS